MTEDCTHPPENSIHRLTQMPMGPRYNQRVTEISERAEQFTEAERARLAPYFTNLDGHVFALTNLPETVKGALFARYSRSSKSLRRLFLDEFADKVTPPAAAQIGRAHV